MARVSEKLALAPAVVTVALTRPTEILDRLRGRRENRRQRSRLERSAMPALATTADPIGAVHALLRSEPCGDCSRELPRVEAELFGRDAQSHPDDGGTTLARILWMTVRHRRPERVVETGVFRGVSSALMLDALERNGTGHLWSIDLPPEKYLRKFKVGSAVPDRLRDRWTYIRGASRRHLPPLLDELGTVDVFVHDGLHTLETMTFEFDQVWPRLAPDGVLVADDVDVNEAFTTFSTGVGREPLLVGEPDKGTVVGMLRR